MKGSVGPDLESKLFAKVISRRQKEQVKSTGHGFWDCNIQVKGFFLVMKCLASDLVSIPCSMQTA